MRKYFSIVAFFALMSFCLSSMALGAESRAIKDLRGTWSGGVLGIDGSSFVTFTVNIDIAQQKNYRLLGTIQFGDNEPQTIIGVFYNGDEMQLVTETTTFEGGVYQRAGTEYYSGICKRTKTNELEPAIGKFTLTRIK